MTTMVIAGRMMDRVSTMVPMATTTQAVMTIPVLHAALAMPPMGPDETPKLELTSTRMTPRGTSSTSYEHKKMS